MKLDELSGVSSKSLLNTVEFIGHMFFIVLWYINYPNEYKWEIFKREISFLYVCSLDDIFSIKVGVRNTTPPPFEDPKYLYLDPLYNGLLKFY